MWPVPKETQRRAHIRYVMKKTRRSDIHRDSDVPYSVIIIV